MTYGTSASSGASQLSSWRECAASDCLPRKYFTYPKTTTKDFNYTTWYGHDRGIQRSITGDFNGDGLTDLAGYVSGNQWRVCLSSNGANFNCRTWYAHNRGIARTVTGDFNGDGKTDIAAAPSNYYEHFWTVCLSTGVVFSCSDWVGGASNIVSNEAATVVGDFDGDGRSDLARIDLRLGLAGWQVCYSTGGGISCADEYGPGGGSARNVRPVDVNGDGRTDLLRHVSGSNWEVCKTSGRWDVGLFQCSEWQGVPGGLENVVINDFNGDGLADIAGWQGATTWKVCLSSGTAFVCDLWSGTNQPARDNIVGDFNGDGRSDLAARTSLGYRVCISGGEGFQCSNWNDSGATLANTLAGDFNGDGLTDLAGHYSGTQWRVSTSEMVSTDRLSQVNNSIGDVTEISYKALTDSSVYTPLTGASYPFVDVVAPIHVVSSVSSSNGVGGTLSTSYEYGGLRKDLENKLAVGFAWVESRQPETGARTRTDYIQSWLYAGKPSQIRKWSGSRLVDQSLFYYDCRSLGTDQCSRGIARFYFPYQSGSLERSWDLNGIRLPDVETTTEYDDYGNAVYVRTSTSDGHGKTTENSYMNDTGNWRLGRLIRSEVTSSAPGVPDQTRTAAFRYSSDDDILVAEVIEPDQSELCVVTIYQHDQYGNKVGQTVRNCAGGFLHDGSEAPAPDGDAVFESRSSTVGFDSRGQFATSVTNALDHREERSFDSGTGSLLSVTDPNGLTTEWEYDALGRKVLEVRPDGNRTRWSYSYCSGVNGGSALCPQYAKYVIEESPTNSSNVPNGPWVRTYYDVADRVIAVRSVGFNGLSEIWQETEYDGLGRIARKSRPHFSSDNPRWTRYTYDALGRELTETYPDNSQTTTSYDGLTTSVTNALNQTEARTLDSQGRLIKVRDAAGNELHYTYDAQGNLLTTTDPMGNVVSLEYDLRGRKVGMVDPDMGAWQYDYNALGELVRQTDAKGQETTMEYDVLGRMTGRAEPGLRRSSWFYDEYRGGLLGAMVPCGASIGKLCRATSNNGYRRTFSYDNLGRPTSREVRISLVNYVTDWSYDSDGRVRSMEYPKPAVAFQRFGVTYEYTDLGFLKEVRDQAGDTAYWRAQEMDALGRITRQTYGNGHTKQHVYDPITSRLSDIVTDGGSVQDLSYQYDAIGNLKARSDSQSLLTETFYYDNLNRLDTAVVDPLFGATQSTSYEYDALGNLVERSDLGEYDYGTGAGVTRPHAVAEIGLNGGGTKEYEYDANGNLIEEVRRDAEGALIRREGRSVSWTVFNQPERIDAEGGIVDFDYGSEHQRIEQRSRPGPLRPARTTVYVHDDNAGGLHFERDTQGLTTELRYFIVAAGQVVAIAKGSSPASVELTYLHQDHLGSVTVVGEDEHLGYEPFGKRRFPNGDPDPDNTLVGVGTNRGFTGHEHLDRVGLIHMNGRVYDPQIGRFLSPDPFIQAGANLQSYNRYSYAINNPLRYVDPSGYSWLGDQWDRFTDELGRWERDFRHEIRRPGSLLGSVLRIGGAAISVVACQGGTAGCYAAIAGATEAAVSRAQGVTGTDLLRNVAISAGTAYGFAHVGGQYDAGTFRSYAGHGLVGCGSAAASGGKCAQGAAAAFLGKFTTVRTASLDEGVRFVAAVAAGGTGAAISGGKFENGAVTAAFGYLFNEWASGARRRAERADLAARQSRTDAAVAAWFGDNRAGFARSSEVTADWFSVVGAAGATRGHIPIAIVGGGGALVFDGLGLLLSPPQSNTHSIALSIDAVAGEVIPGYYGVAYDAVSPAQVLYHYPLPAGSLRGEGGVNRDDFCMAC